MYQIKIENCNNIAEGELTIEDGKLNILSAVLAAATGDSSPKCYQSQFHRRREEAN